MEPVWSWCSEKKSVVLIHFLFLNGKHNPCVSTLHIIVPKPQNVKKQNKTDIHTQIEIHLFVHANITKIHKKQKPFLYDSDSWQGAQCRPNGRSVLNFPQAHSLRLSGKYFPSYHTHTIAWGCFPESKYSKNPLFWLDNSLNSEESGRLSEAPIQQQQ